MNPPFQRGSTWLPRSYNSADGFLDFMFLFQVFLLLAKPLHLFGYLFLFPLTSQNISVFFLESTIIENKTRFAKNFTDNLVLFFHIDRYENQDKTDSFPHWFKAGVVKDLDPKPPDRPPTALCPFSNFPEAAPPPMLPPGGPCQLIMAEIEGNLICPGLFPKHILWPIGLLCTLGICLTLSRLAQMPPAVLK